MSITIPQDMCVVTIPDLKALVHAVGIRRRRPLMVWGPSGVGKTQAIGQVAAEVRGAYCPIMLSQYESVDLRGIPSLDPATQQTTWYPPSTIPFVGNPLFDPTLPCILVHLDEITHATTAVRSAAYQLILERRLGEHTLMDNVVLVASGNRESDKGINNPMPYPLCNRFTHVEVGVDVDAWCVEMQRRGRGPTGVAFMQFRPELLHTFNPERPSKVFATPRSWEVALDYLDDATMSEDLKRSAITGTIGMGPTTELLAFVRLMHQMPSLAAIRATPTTTPIPEESSLKWATAISVSGAMTKDSADAFHQYLTRLNAEFVLVAWKLALRRDVTLTETSAFMAVSKQYSGVLQG